MQKNQLGVKGFEEHWPCEVDFVAAVSQHQADYMSVLLQHELDLVTTALHAAHGQHTDRVFDDRYLCTHKKVSATQIWWSGVVVSNRRSTKLIYAGPS